MSDESPILDTESPGDGDERHPLDVLAEEFSERCRRGDHPSVADYARQYPQYADQLRELLPPIALMEKLKRRNLSGTGGIAQSPLKLDRLGDFRILREVGRGGMGIVYEAQQESLGRHVALKVLSRASLLDPQRVQRFEREAKAAANLHHTNIVPVFGVGETDGLHYYVMQFIEGRSLGHVITDLAGKDHPGTPTTSRQSSASAGATVARSPSKGDSIVAAPSSSPPTGKRYWRWIAELGRQVADALDYAHRQGTLHRDVKPANLILDERGTVWITDFGLAKLGEEFNNVTRTGDLIGTLQYMAPESLRAQTDARSDIYGLGITLYEMLTLHPAFNEPNPAALMRRVAESDPVAPRRLNPHVPQDLETIILKSIARDPAARYRTAGQLADDLENFLHDRPITARRISIPERMWRWCRRNRAVAVLSALAITSAVAAIIIGWSAYGITRRALTAEATRRSEAETAKRRADDNVALSLASFEEIFNQLAPEDDMPPPVAGMGPREGSEGPSGQDGPPRRRDQRDPGQDAALLRSILNFYDRFVQQNPTNPNLQAEAGKAYRRVGDSYYHLGQSSIADADAAYRRSAAIFTELLKSDPDSERYRTGFVAAVIRLGIDADTMQPDDVKSIHRAAEIAGDLVKQQPGDRRQLELLSRAYLRDGNVLRKLGELPQAEARFRRSAEAWREASPPPRDRDHNDDGRRLPPRPPDGYAPFVALAQLMLDTNRPDEARAAVRDAFAELNRNWDDMPAHARAQRASAYERLAPVAAAAGESDIAARSRTRAALPRLPRDGGFNPNRPPREPPP